MNKNKGFSLIELMVVLAIIALLVSYALPNYRQYVIKSKRAVAQNKILEIAGMYEKFYANTNSYPVGLSGGGTSLSLPTSYLEDDEYTFTVDNSGSIWTIVGTATHGQTDDEECPTITFTNLGTKGPYATCWE